MRGGGDEGWGWGGVGGVGWSVRGGVECEGCFFYDQF